MVVVYTAVISSADGITKLLAGGYEAAQIYVFSGALIAVLSLLAALARALKPDLGFARRSDAADLSDTGLLQRRREIAWPWRTACPWGMALRSLAAVLAALCFFYAFYLLPFAQVFLFIGLMPLMAGILSGLVLSETIRLSAWLALLAGFVGVLFLFPSGIASISPGHFLALGGAGFGTLSMIMARYISRFDRDLLPQVFFPNLALCLVMVPVLPFVWKDMPLADLGWATCYAVLLFAARWLAVAALRLLPAYVVTPLMNLQFIWMLLIGAVIFGEIPSQGTWIGGAIVISSGLFLLWGQVLSTLVAERFASAGDPATAPRVTAPLRRVPDIAGE